KGHGPVVYRAQRRALVCDPRRSGGALATCAAMIWGSRALHAFEYAAKVAPPALLLTPSTRGVTVNEETRVIMDSSKDLRRRLFPRCLVFSLPGFACPSVAPKCVAKPAHRFKFAIRSNSKAGACHATRT